MGKANFSDESKRDAVAQVAERLFGRGGLEASGLLPAPWLAGKVVWGAFDLKNYSTSPDLLDQDEKGAHGVDTLVGNPTMIIAVKSPPCDVKGLIPVSQSRPATASFPANHRFRWWVSGGSNPRPAD